MTANSRDTLFLTYSIEKLMQQRGRIDDCLTRLNDELIWSRSAGEAQNAVANHVLHLCGNVRQWIGTGVAGQPNIRQRDQEFAARGGVSREELRGHIKKAVDEAVAVLQQVTPEQLEEPLAVQGYTVTKLEGIYHVVEHFSLHTGQIMLLTKQFTGQDLGYYCNLDSSNQNKKP